MSRLDRMQRLLKRTRDHLKSVNGLSDRICRKHETQRGKKADKLYRQARRLRTDIKKELKR
jgi:hypothetical protein